MHKKKVSGIRVPKSKDSPKGSICANGSCKLRKAGCKGYEGCPGYIKK